MNKAKLRIPLLLLNDTNITKYYFVYRIYRLYFVIILFVEKYGYQMMVSMRSNCLDYRKVLVILVNIGLGI